LVFPYGGLPKPNCACSSAFIQPRVHAAILSLDLARGELRKPCVFAVKSAAAGSAGVNGSGRRETFITMGPLEGLRWPSSRVLLPFSRAKYHVHLDSVCSKLNISPMSGLTGYILVTYGLRRVVEYLP
jgi:hypothetical protein